MPLQSLEQYGAKGTFDIVGDTSKNYPDVAGEHGSASWGGVKFDHYPDINEDHLGGAVHCPELTRRILEGGHQIANHTYSHFLFGKKPLVYGKRTYLNNVHEVVEDLQKLHTLLQEEFGYTMKFSRPPHYVDKIEGGFSSYDAYEKMGYQYMAASYDGAGWLPLATYEDEVKATYEHIERLLEQDANALCGQIIFQKDGYNMARRTPVAAGLPKQLEILSRYGYKVVTVEELCGYSPFTDIGRQDALFAPALKLVEKGYIIVYRDNTVRPEALLTMEEFAMMLCGNDGFDIRFEALQKNPKGSFFGNIKIVHPYSGAIKAAVDKGYLPLKGRMFAMDERVNAKIFNAACEKAFGKNPAASGKTISHKTAIEILAGLV